MKYTNSLERHLAEVINVSWNYAGRIEDWQDHVTNAVLGLGGEAGEIVDLHKKLFYHTEKDRHEELINEFGDLFFYAAKLMELHGITLEECLAANKVKLTERHPSMFKEMNPDSEYFPEYCLEPLETKPPNPKDLIGSDKLPLSLVPGTTKAYLALGHTEGHLKYGLVNWREAGVRMSIYLDALERHVEKLKGGEWEDQTTQVPHLANAITCLSIVIDAYETGKLIDDRPQAAPVASLIDRFGDKVKHLKKLFGHSRPIDYFLTGAKQR